MLQGRQPVAKEMPCLESALPDLPRPPHVTDTAAPQLRICRADYHHPAHAEALVFLLDAYARDAAGGGIAVLDSSDEAAARRMMEDDPAVRSGLLQATLRPWQMVFNPASDTSPFAEDAADGRARG